MKKFKVYRQQCFANVEDIVGDQGHSDDDVWQERLRRWRSRSRRKRTRERNDRVLRCFFSWSRWLIRRRTGGIPGLLECIMHAKWRGFLEITGAAPLPDEGVLRWRRGSLPTFAGRGGLLAAGAPLQWELKYWRNYIARKARNRLNNHKRVPCLLYTKRYERLLSLCVTLDRDPSSYCHRVKYSARKGGTYARIWATYR